MVKVVIDGINYIPDTAVPGDANEYEKALAARMVHCSDFDDITVSGYFHQLLKTLWIEEECFSGKRPFGNSGWSLDLEYSLIECGFLTGRVVKEPDGWVDGLEDADEEENDRRIESLIKYVFFRSTSSTAD